MAEHIFDAYVNQWERNDGAPITEQEIGQDLAELERQGYGNIQFTPSRPIFTRTFTEEGIWSRIRLCEFGQQIPDSERDKGLPARLLAELPGILNWALAGSLRWQRDGLGVPQDVLAATGAYRAEMDMIGAFLDECCVVGYQRHVTSKDLYARYTRWSEENGERPIAQRTLGQRLIERGFESEKGTGGVRRWVGLTLE